MEHDFVYCPRCTRYSIVHWIRRLGQWECEDERKVVVRGNPIMSLHAAAQAAVRDHVLSVASLECGHRRHRAATLAGPVAGEPSVDMP